MAESINPTFPKFGDLPPELRIKIWQHAIPGPRTVIIESPFTKPQNRVPRSLEDALSRTYDKDGLELTWRSTMEIPALLHVNAEARHEALQHYHLSLGVGPSKPRIYIDFGRDTLFFGHSEIMPECSPLWGATKDLQKVRRLAIVPEGAWRVMHWQNLGFKSLEKIIFVHQTEATRLGPHHQIVEDTHENVTDSKTNIHTDALSSSQRADGVERRPRVEDPQETCASLESILAKFTVSPIKKRIQAAREELDILTRVLPSRWDREPAISTALFKERPERS